MTKTRFLLFFALCFGGVYLQGNAQILKQKFRVHLKGSIVDEKELKNYAHLLVGVLWHHDDLNLKEKGEQRTWNMSANVGKVKKNGKYSFTITEPPLTRSCLVTRRFRMSIGFLVAFADHNKNGKFDEGDKVIGATEHYALSYVNGSYQKGLDALEKKLKKKITTLRQLKNGIYINKAITPEEQKLKDPTIETPFDDLYPLKKQKTKLKVRIPKKLGDLKVPNWT
ncbi:hypothetical protein [Microscilla marina]|uniref:Uncharacterized protein n=1 Tax=Microscilla marina ATCC 23134 TaxID=313606 RepID=A1ZZQ9_MICM2|nr:hypothetical protein [Microscilla marina]EAY24117.1 hypothetical protein M23134_06034 [Microscilla marina ATCC 23134]